MSFLAEHYDPSLEVDPADTVASITAAEEERLERMLAIGSVAFAMPRRLGGEASAEDLALDKKRARRVLHVLHQCIKAWRGEDREGSLPLTDEIRQEAAVISWPTWCKWHQVWLANRIRYVATWGKTNAPDEAQVKKMIVRLQNEQRWLKYALRD